jgi:hypothetical protein
MTKPSNVKALETGSGISWEEWIEFFDGHEKLNHAELATMALERIIETGKSSSPEWWAQGVAVAFEQHIGRRLPGQQNDGSFAVTVSKTFDGDMDAALAQWVAKVGDTREFNGVKLNGEPRTSQTEKWRYWRANLADGSTLAMNFQTKANGEKTAAALNHDKIPNSEAAEKWRAFWKQYLV